VEELQRIPDNIQPTTANTEPNYLNVEQDILLARISKGHSACAMMGLLGRLHKGPMPSSFMN